MTRRISLRGAALGLALAVAAASGNALAAGKVVLYTAHNQSIIDALVPRFEAETGIEAEVIKAGSGDIINRVLAERDNPRGDVIWSIGGEQLEAQSGLLEPYRPTEADKIDPVFMVGTNWLPYTAIVNVFVVNKEKLDPSQYPRTWKDLGRPDLKGKISSARADKSGSSYMQLANVLTVYGDGDDGWAVYRPILGNFVLSGSSSAVSRFVNDGEALVGVTLEDNAYKYVQGGGPVEIVYPADGTVAAPDGIALIKGAPNADNARRFIDWALSKPTQEFLVAEMGRRPVRSDVKASGDLPPVSSFKVVRYDFGWAASNKGAFVKRWQELLMTQ
ncbi:MAG: extracellular solute-binding protein [Ectothiorhodospiraceae bacterium]|nr:extracellular solute-binding protein [Chromatiales bacterium]MCP5154946.1 extracellular solute-binding protein [Ectothiorhodospiraceae bacterium]